MEKTVILEIAGVVLFIMYIAMVLLDIKLTKIKKELEEQIKIEKELENQLELKYLMMVLRKHQGYSPLKGIIETK